MWFVKKNPKKLFFSQHFNADFFGGLNSGSREPGKGEKTAVQERKICFWNERGNEDLRMRNEE